MASSPTKRPLDDDDDDDESYDYDTETDSEDVYMNSDNNNDEDQQPSSSSSNNNNNNINTMILDLSVSMDKLQTVLPPLLQHAEHVQSVVYHILLRLSESDDEREQVQLLQLLCRHATPHVQMTESLTMLLTCVSRSMACHIIDRMAQLCGDSEIEAEMVLSAYKEVLQVDRSLIVPVLGSLSDLRLSDAMKDSVYQMAYQALSIVDENDFPAIIRTILRTTTTKATLDAIDAIRRETRQMSPHYIRVVVEVIVGCLHVNPRVGNVLLASIRRTTQSLSPLELVILALLHNDLRYTGTARGVMWQLIMTGHMDVYAFRILAQGEDMHEVVQAFADHFVDLAQAIVTWINACDQSVYHHVYNGDTPPPLGDNEWTDLSLHFATWGYEVLILLCTMLPSHLPTLMKLLTVSCLNSSAHRQHTTRTRDPWWSTIAASVSPSVHRHTTLESLILRDNALISQVANPAAECCSRVLVSLATADAELIAPHSGLVSELLFDYDMIPRTVYTRIALTLACLSVVPGYTGTRSLATTMLFVQKSILSASSITQDAALVVLHQLLHMNCFRHDNESFNRALGWLQQLMPKPLTTTTATAAAAAVTSSNDALVFASVMYVLVRERNQWPDEFSDRVLRRCVLPLAVELNVIQLRTRGTSTPWNSLNDTCYLTPLHHDVTSEIWAMSRVAPLWSAFISYANDASLPLSMIIDNHDDGGGGGGGVGALLRTLNPIVCDSLTLLTMGMSLGDDMVHQVRARDEKNTRLHHASVLRQPLRHVDIPSDMMAHDDITVVYLTRIRLWMRVLLLIVLPLRSVVNDATHGVHVLSQSHGDDDDDEEEEEKDLLCVAVREKTIAAVQVSARIREAIFMLNEHLKTNTSSSSSSSSSLCAKLSNALAALAPPPCLLAWVFTCRALRLVDGDSKRVRHEIVIVRTECLQILFTHLWSSSLRHCPFGHHFDHTCVLFGCGDNGGESVTHVCPSTTTTTTNNNNNNHQPSFHFGVAFVKALCDSLPVLCAWSEQARTKDEYLWELSLLSLHFTYSIIQLAVLERSPAVTCEWTQLRQQMLQHTDLNAALGAFSVCVAMRKAAAATTTSTSSSSSSSLQQQQQQQHDVGALTRECMEQVYTSSKWVPSPVTSLPGIMSIFSSIRRDWIRFDVAPQSIRVGDIVLSNLPEFIINPTIASRKRNNNTTTVQAAAESVHAATPTSNFFPSWSLFNPIPLLVYNRRLARSYRECCERVMILSLLSVSPTTRTDITHIACMNFLSMCFSSPSDILQIVQRGHRIADSLELLFVNNGVTVSNMLPIVNQDTALSLLRGLYLTTVIQLAQCSMSCMPLKDGVWSFVEFEALVLLLLRLNACLLCGIDEDVQAHMLGRARRRRRERRRQRRRRQRKKKKKRTEDNDSSGDDSYDDDDDDDGESEDDESSTLFLPFASVKAVLVRDAFARGLHHALMVLSVRIVDGIQLCRLPIQEWRTEQRYVPLAQGERDPRPMVEERALVLCYRVLRSAAMVKHVLVNRRAMSANAAHLRPDAFQEILDKLCRTYSLDVSASAYLSDTNVYAWFPTTGELQDVQRARSDPQMTSVLDAVSAACANGGDGVGGGGDGGGGVGDVDVIVNMPAFSVHRPGRPDNNIRVS